MYKYLFYKICDYVVGAIDVAVAEADTVESSA
jgi:hypothetical protein